MKKKAKKLKTNEKLMEKLNESEEEMIEKEFDELVIERMSDAEFWKYNATWQSTESIVEQMRDWKTETKKEAIKEIYNMFPKLRKK